jgi:hypothetical protein
VAIDILNAFVVVNACWTRDNIDMATLKGVSGSKVQRRQAIGDCSCASAWPGQLAQAA